MASNPSRQPELALPASSLAALRDALAASLGPEAAAQALRTAGHAAGDAFHRILIGSEADFGSLPADRFWFRLARLFSARGWGHLTYREVHPGVGSLEAHDWAESGPAALGEAGGATATGGGTAPVCHVTTGVLANLLGRVAGTEVAVLEVECRGRGDARCRFLFGGPDAVYAVYERLSAGESPEGALAQIG